MDENGEKVKGQKTAASYNDEWEELFGNKFYLEKLRNIGLKGQLRSCVFRSICWRVYLECLSDQRSEWISKARDLRSQYEEIKYKLQLKTNPRHEELKLDLAVNNPLSQELESPWNQFFQDSELKATIKQDVIRTFPEIEFFHTQEIQVMMVDILFSYAREYPAVSYRQGMHELLAPILFVLHSDQQSFLLASEIGYVNLVEERENPAVEKVLKLTPVFHDILAPKEQKTSEGKLSEAIKYIQQLKKQVEQLILFRFGLQRFSSDVKLIPFYIGFASYALFMKVLHIPKPTAEEITRWSQVLRQRIGQCKNINTDLLFRH